MMVPRALIAAVLMPLAVGPGWTAEVRLRLPGPGAVVTAEPVAIDPADPARRRVGGLTFLGGVTLGSEDRAFGGFSALLVDGERFTLLSDGGTVLRFRMGADWRVRGPRLTAIPAGPRTGWRKRDRDVESVARDPATGAVWVGFENVDQIWRFTPDLARAERFAQPEEMWKWKAAGGIESFTRLADGRFVAIAESPVKRGRPREGVVWPDDPTVRRSAFKFLYRPARGYDPSDMVELPDGRLLVLERRFALPFRWSARLVTVDRAAIRPGARVEGRLLAEFVPPLVTDNYEGVAVTREDGATMLWLLSDDNQMALQRTLLLKFRVDG